MYTYLLIVQMFGSAYSTENIPVLSAKQCIEQGEVLYSSSPAKGDYFFVCAPLEVSGIEGRSTPVYGLGEGPVYGGYHIPKIYHNIIRVK